MTMASQQMERAGVCTKYFSSYLTWIPIVEEVVFLNRRYCNIALQRCSMMVGRTASTGLVGMPKQGSRGWQNCWNN